MYPRLLAENFAACFRFYAAVLPRLAGLDLDKGAEDGFYANWDRADRTGFALFDRNGQVGAGASPGRDGVALVFPVDDVDAALAHCLGHGGRLVAPATDRPEWGPNLRTAHLRDPDGNLLELQSY